MSFNEVKLKYIAHLNPSKSEINLSEIKEQVVSFLPMDKIISQNNLDLSLNKPIEEVYTGYTYFRENDIVLAKVTPCFENGNLAVAKGLTNKVGFGTTELHVLRVNEKFYDTEYIYYCLQLEDFKTEAVANMYGVGGLKRIPTEFLSEYKFLVPDLKKQISIRKYLNLKLKELSNLIKSKTKLISLLEQQRQSVITEAVTKGLNPNVKMKDSGAEWIGEIPEHWNIINVRNLLRKNIISIQDGNHGELHPTTDDYVNIGIPFVMANNIRKNKLNLRDCKFISKDLADTLRIGFSKPGDVLLTHKGTIGEVAIVPNITTPYLMLTPQVTYYRVLNNNLIVNKYLFYYFQSKIFKDQLKLISSMQSTRSYIGLVAQKELLVTLPILEEQIEIIRQLDEESSKLQKIIDKVELQIEKLKEYRQSLIYDTVTGKIDVRDMELD
ncbi:restriction endonuclease subunit S [Viridibacillus arvi]|uniref:restriction endonuclease subunit S n=1 Tax=Viridibacillus arvi TaxID=263475 RepID=UPI0036EF2F55